MCVHLCVCVCACIEKSGPGIRTCIMNAIIIQIKLIKTKTHSAVLAAVPVVSPESFKKRGEKKIKVEDVVTQS